MVELEQEPAGPESTERLESLGPVESELAVAMRTSPSGSAPGGAPPAPPTRGRAAEWLARMPDDQRADTVRTIQRTAGNAAVTGLVRSYTPADSRGLQRWTAPLVSQKSDEELIRDAIDNGDVAAIKEIDDYGKVPPGDRMKMIGMLVGQGWVGPRDESALAGLWNTWGGAALVQQASANIGLWKQSVEHVSALENHPEVEKTRLGFLAAVQSTVSGYLKENREIVEKEAVRLGVDLSRGSEPSVLPAGDEEIKKQQEILEQVADAQTVMNALRGVQVGYVEAYDPTAGGERDPLAGGETKTRQRVPFVPGNPPGSGPVGDEDPPMTPYEQVLSTHQGLQDKIAQLAAKNPAVYAVVSQSGGDPEASEEVAKANPEQARAKFAEAFTATLQGIVRTEGKLEDDSFLLKVHPVHKQVLATPKFSNAFAAAVVDKEVEDYKDAQFWQDVGLGTLAAATFIVGTLASGGLAAFMLGAALVTGGAEAAIKYEDWATLDAAHKASVSDQTKLVDKGDVDAAELAMIIAVGAAILDLAGIAVKLVRPLLKVTVNWGKRLAHGGMAGGRCVGVFEAAHYGFGPDVVVKVFRTGTPEEIAAFEAELAGAMAAGRGKNAARCWGEVPVNRPGHRGYAMTKVEGGVTEFEDLPGMTAKQIAEGEAEALKWASKVRKHTAADVRSYGKSVLDGGNYVPGDVQGLVGPDGHWKAIDFGTVKKLPDPTDPYYATALKHHNAAIEEVAQGYDRLAARNPTTPP